MNSTQDEILRSVRVLVVDDDHDILRTIELYLTEHGAEVTAVDNAQDALYRIGVSQPEVLVLDLMMPGISGAELMVRLREMGLHIPTIIITADSEAPRRMRGGGQDGLLVKPFPMSELVAAIDKLRTRARPWQA